MKIYIITRFSIYDKKYSTSKYFQITTNNKNNYHYKKKLFNENRLDLKFKIFKMITLPSIINQTNQNFEWYIYTSSFLPKKYKKNLLQLVKFYSQIKICYVESFADFFKFKELKHLDSTDKTYCTLRIDDDDGLNKNFLKTIIDNYSHLNKVIISFPRGIKFEINDEEEIIEKGILKQRNIACGLSAIGMNIYLCGDHSTFWVNKKHKVVYNPTDNMYLKYFGKWSDTEHIQNWR